MSEFTRCTSRAKHGGRCWRGAHTTGKHLVLPPGKVPTLAQIEKIIVARPDVNREVVFRAVVAEHTKSTQTAQPSKDPWGSFDRVFKKMDGVFEEMHAMFDEVFPPRK